MGIIDINLDETPDREMPIEVGLRVLELVDIEEQEKDGRTIYNAKFKVNEPDADDHERVGFERFDFQYPKAQIKFKQMIRALGHDGTGSGVDTADLIGCTCKAHVAERTYVDKDTDETISTTQVKKFLVEAS